MARKKAKNPPPWGNILGGKPIERWCRRDDPADGQMAEKEALHEQFRRMCVLREHYGINKGLGWYKLALAIASELDNSLKIIDPAPRPAHKTSRKWATVEGVQLVAEIEAMRQQYPRPPARNLPMSNCSPSIRSFHSRHRKMDFDSFKSRYYDALRYHARPSTGRVGDRPKSTKRPPTFATKSANTELVHRNKWHHERGINEAKEQLHEAQHSRLFR